MLHVSAIEIFTQCVSVYVQFARIYKFVQTLSGIAGEIYVCAGGKLLKQKEEKG